MVKLNSIQQRLQQKISDRDEKEETLDKHRREIKKQLQMES